GMGRSVVPLVRAGDAVILEPVARWRPGLATVVRALDELPEPAGALRRVQPIGIRGRAFQMVHLPAPEEGTADAPPLPLPVRREDEPSLPRADQHPYATHACANSFPAPPMPEGITHCMVERPSRRSTGGATRSRATQRIPTDWRPRAGWRGSGAAPRR